MAAYRHGRVCIDDAAEHIQYRVHVANTIAEDLRKVRVEIAAVIAATLAGCGGLRLLEGPPTQASLGAFMRMLDNKGMTGLVCYLMALSRDFPDRFTFYRHIGLPETQAVLRGFA
jgi:hypothetical protein